MRIDIDRVTLVTGALFKINPIWQDLFRRLGKKYVLAMSTPVFCPIEKRKLSTQIVKSESLAGQMSVRAVVLGQISLDVTSVLVQVFQRLLEKPGRKMFRVLKEMKRPDPRHRTHRHFETANPVDP